MKILVTPQLITQILFSFMERSATDVFGRTSYGVRMWQCGFQDGKDCSDNI